MSVYLSPVFGAGAQLFDNQGRVLAGGSISTYLAGTSTPASTFTDNTGLTSNGPAITLDSAGRTSQEIWITGGTSLKIIVKNSVGVQQGQTWDGVQGINDPSLFPTSLVGTITYSDGTVYPSGSVGYFLQNYDEGGVDAVPRKITSRLKDFVSVKDFGAIGNGIVDDTAAVQSALTAVGTRTYDGALFIPAGKYKITSTLTVPDRVSIYGEGGMASTIQAYSCDGLTFTAPNSEGETFFFEDFSIEGMAGANFTAVNSPVGGGIKYGLHFSRLRLRNMNGGINLANNLHCSIDHCSFTEMNQPVSLGDVSTFTKITASTMICGGGDDWSSSGAKRGIYVPGGSNCEATKISENFIYGFAKAIELGTTTDVQILNNGLDACLEYGIYFQAVQHNFNIKDNFIELLGATAVAGIYGLPVGSGEYLSQINIEGNSFTELGSAAVSTIGILINTTVDTYQWHLRITGNVFNSMKTHDIKLNLPGEVHVSNNRLMSAAPTYSLWVGSVNKAPVIVRDNWLKKAVYLDVPTDVSTGLLELSNNVESDAFQTKRRSAAPVNGAWRVGDVVYNNAPASAGYVGWVCTVAGTPGTWKAFGLIS